MCVTKRCACVCIAWIRRMRCVITCAKAMSCRWKAVQEGWRCWRSAGLKARCSSAFATTSTASPWANVIARQPVFPCPSSACARLCAACSRSRVRAHGSIRHSLRATLARCSIAPLEQPMHSAATARVAQRATARGQRSNQMTLGFAGVFVGHLTRHRTFVALVAPALFPRVRQDSDRTR